MICFPSCCEVVCFYRIWTVLRQLTMEKPWTMHLREHSTKANLNFVREAVAIVSVLCGFQLDGTSRWWFTQFKSCIFWQYNCLDFKRWQCNRRKRKAGASNSKVLLFWVLFAGALPSQCGSIVRLCHPSSGIWWESRSSASWVSKLPCCFKKLQPTRHDEIDVIHSSLQSLSFIRINNSLLSNLDCHPDPFDIDCPGNAPIVFIVILSRNLLLSCGYLSHTWYVIKVLTRTAAATTTTYF